MSNNLKIFNIKYDDSGQPLLKLLLKWYRGVPASVFFKSIRKGNIKINRKKTKPDQILNTGDQLYLFQEFHHTNREIEPSALKPAIVYEDDNILVADKPAGMPSHPDSTHKNDTMIDVLLSYLGISAAWEGMFIPALCNRLDVNTDGLIILAKTSQSLRAINCAIARGEIRRFYHARTFNVPDPIQGVVEIPLKRSGGKTVVTPIGDGGKTSKTLYRVLEAREGACGVEVEILTGRTHQVRVALAHIGCPLIGDTKYGGIRGKFSLSCTRLEFKLTAPPEGLAYLSDLTIVKPNPSGF